MNQPVLSGTVRTAIEVAVYLLLIFAIVAWCLQILRPFVSFIVWGTIIAVAMHIPFMKLRAKLGDRNKLAVAVFVVLGLATIIVPTWMFAGSLLDSVHQFHANLETGQHVLPAPGENVKDWPVVGERIYTNWSAAATNMEDWLEKHNEQVKEVTSTVLSRMAGIGLSILQFIAATFIAAAMLAHEENTRMAIRRFARRLVGDHAEPMVKLTAATIRSVAVGVLGIAFIQALLGGAGMMLAGVPGAGLWALIILVLAIAQLPPLVVLLPAALYVFSANDSTMVGVVFAIWSVLVSFSDAALKPIFLGRGVEAPMLVILLGAIGGMLLSGIVGLFIGAVVLALGYKLFEAWLDDGEPQVEEF